MKRRIPMTGDMPRAAEPERTAWHHAAERHGCPLARCAAASPNDCASRVRIDGQCMAASVAEREAAP